MSRWSVAVAVLLVLGCKKQREPDRAAATGLRDGDLIFHESRSAQSEMVRALTDSRWTHMGVVFERQGKLFVFEAVSPVKYTPLAEWTKRGQGGRYVVKRLSDAERRLSPAALAKMRALGKSWLGRPYDLRFRWDDQSLYCSELAYKLFDRAAGVQLGKLQTAADMNLDHPRVQQALKERFAGAKLDPNEVVITPDAMFNDPQLVEVDSRL